MRNSVCSTSTPSCSHPVHWSLLDMGTDDAGEGCGQLQLIVDAIIGPYPFDQSASSSPSCAEDDQFNFSEWRRPPGDNDQTRCRGSLDREEAQTSQVKINEELNICR